MARDINKRLGRLKERRTGTDRLHRLTEDAKIAVLAQSLYDEAYQKRAPTNKPNTRYALGAMQEVGPGSTKVSIETAERVGNQLEKGLEPQGFTVDFRLQGSVPLNVHTHGVSDVDLLNLETGFFTYATFGLRSRLGQYTASPKTSVGVLMSLRTASERILRDKFPSADVDCSGGKAICISGGSIARPVDVVVSHWFDTIDYQQSGQEHDRGVTILNKKVPTTINNLPFLHIKRINDRDDAVWGGLKKAIRLCKNVKNDAEAEGTTITLPSFDIAATMYHANQAALAGGHGYELAILAETQRHLNWLTTNEEEAKKLFVPDGSRRIFDTPEKLAGLRKLSTEVDDLLMEVGKEQATILSQPTSWADSRNLLAKSYIPAV